MTRDLTLAPEYTERLLGLLERIAVALEQGGPRPRRPSERRRPKDDVAASSRSFVRVQLLNGPKAWTEIAAEGKKSGHAEITLRRHRKDVARSVFINGHWYWQLLTESPEGS